MFSLNFRKLLLLFGLIVTPVLIFSQVVINIKVKQTHTPIAKLYLMGGKNKFFVDSTRLTDRESYIFKLPLGYKEGLYKVTLGKNINFDFIVANESDISIETTIFTAKDSLKAVASDENKLYFQYQKLKQYITHQAWLLNSLQDYYSDSTMFGQIIESEIYKVKSDFLHQVHDLIKSKDRLLSTSIILLEQRPIPPSYLNSEEQKEYILQYWWENCNLSDSRLIGFEALNKKLWDYFELLFNDRLDKEQQDSVFIEGIKTIMNLNAAVCIKEYFRKEIYQEFYTTDYRTVADYLAKSTFSGLPSFDMKNLVTDTTRVNGKANVGDYAFDFKIADKAGKKVKISKIDSKYKLLIFWASWCPHCIETLPEINSIYKDFRDKGFEVIAIAIDSEGLGWKNIVEDNKWDWINSSEPDTGENKVLTEYNVDETPSLFLVDRNLKIVSRPATAKQLEAKLMKLLP